MNGCTECNEPREGIPACGCPPGYWEDENGTCMKCGPKCKECKGGSYNCTKCNTTDDERND